MAAYCEVPAEWVSKRDVCRKVLERDGRPQGTRLYAIMDLAAVPDAEAWHTRLARKTPARSLFDGQPEESAREQAPWLVPIDQAGDIFEFLERSVDEAVCNQSVCWLSSALPIAPLAERLARRTTARLPEGEALLRYYDPRLSAALWSVLPPDTRAKFGAFGERWWYLDADLTLQNITLPGTGGDDPFQPPLVCSEVQMRAMLDVSEQYQLVDFLCKRRPEKFQSLDRGQRLRFVARHDAAARQRHVGEFADRLRYCELALEHGEDFAERRDWQPVWQAMQTNGVRLQQALERGSPGAKP